jgi:hypothetical protein
MCGIYFAYKILGEKNQRLLPLAGAGVLLTK